MDNVHGNYDNTQQTRTKNEEFSGLRSDLSKGMTMLLRLMGKLGRSQLMIIADAGDTNANDAGFISLMIKWN